MSQLKVGQIFGISIQQKLTGLKRLRNWLYPYPRTIRMVCEVLEVNEGIIRGYVINGRWDFHFNTTTKCISFEAPSGYQVVHDHEISVIGPVPSRISHKQYDEYVEDFLNKQIQRNIISQWWIKETYTIVETVSKQLYRFKKSYKAFKDAWNGKRSVWDDDIPF